MTGTDHRIVEELPDGIGTHRDWAVLLAGPAIWINHFMVVYLAAEATCSPLDADQYELLGADTLVVLTLVATVLAALACVGVAVVARRRLRTLDGDRPYAPGMARSGALLAVGAAIGVLAVGLPAAYLSPVC